MRCNRCNAMTQIVPHHDVCHRCVEDALNDYKRREIATAEVMAEIRRIPQRALKLADNANDLVTVVALENVAKDIDAQLALLGRN